MLQSLVGLLISATCKISWITSPLSSGLKKMSFHYYSLKYAVLISCRAIHTSRLLKLISWFEAVQNVKTYLLRVPCLLGETEECYNKTKTREWPFCITITRENPCIQLLTCIGLNLDLTKCFDHSAERKDYVIKLSVELCIKWTYIL